MEQKEYKIIFCSITFKLNLAISSFKFSLLPKTMRSSDGQNMFDCEIHVKKMLENGVAFVSKKTR